MIKRTWKLNDPYISTTECSKSNYTIIGDYAPLRAHDRRYYYYVTELRIRISDKSTPALFPVPTNDCSTLRYVYGSEISPFLVYLARTAAADDLINIHRVGNKNRHLSY